MAYRNVGIALSACLGRRPLCQYLSALRRSLINYTPATMSIAAGTVQIMRYDLRAGDRPNMGVQLIRGDLDLFLWAPDARILPRAPWSSNLGGSQIDQVIVVAPIDGVYQLELLGYTAAEFTLDVQVTPAVAVASGAEAIACSAVRPDWRTA